MDSKLDMQAMYDTVIDQLGKVVGGPEVINNTSPDNTLQCPKYVKFSIKTDYVPKLYFRTYPLEAQECSHDFATYIGFTESFEYCRKCDYKRSLT